VGQLVATRKLQSVVHTAVPLMDKDFDLSTVRHKTYEVLLSANIRCLKLYIERHTNCESGAKIRDKQVAKLLYKYPVYYHRNILVS